MSTELETSYGWVVLRGEELLVITPAGLKLTPKGKRKGQEILWDALISGEAALAVALNASLEGQNEG